jgi:rhodanese-related sulfurtransferase
MTQPVGAGAIPAIDVSETASRLESGGSDGPILVDVREDDELRAARVAGAIHVPMSSFADRYAELPQNRPLLVMCATGGRSSAATAFLLRNGWTDVVNVKGGITAWQQAGMPIRTGPIEPGEGDL